MGAIKGSSGSATVSFSQAVKLDNYGLNVVVDVRIDEGASYLAPEGTPIASPASDSPVAKDDQNTSARRTRPTDVEGDQGTPTTPGSLQLANWTAELSKKDPMKFLATCGDSFVMTIRKASEIEGVYMIETRSTSEQESLSQTIGGSYGPF